ncbi:hypothetical protein NV379_19670 [Paenibacillus sp. N1-5-1-14]|uniref:hypothetical protein n=1 Tax=Paenibacillus radicibacter TaxID=2972488 RepID=UPI002158D912|nr:hypothetical protein [Paenibacillus radicibacter]MCR8644876.1 hypothetical protein [Paenibacillus radicibacter]
MKAKKLIAYSILSLGILGASYFIADQRIVDEKIGIFYDHAVYDDADKLSDEVSLIVSVTPTTDNKEVFEGGEYNDSYTITNVTVDKIYKNSNDNTNSLENLAVIERFFTVDNGLNPGRTKILGEGYTPLIPGKKYILFLNWSNERQAYWIHAVNQGKINIDGQDTREISLESHDDRFKILRESVLKKYTTAIEDGAVQKVN